MRYIAIPTSGRIFLQQNGRWSDLFRTTFQQQHSSAGTVSGQLLINPLATAAALTPPNQKHLSPGIYFFKYSLQLMSGVPSVMNEQLSSKSSSLSRPPPPLPFASLLLVPMIFRLILEFTPTGLPGLLLFLPARARRWILATSSAAEAWSMIRKSSSSCWPPSFPSVVSADAISVEHSEHRVSN